MGAKRRKKPAATKSIQEDVWTDGSNWNVKQGELKRGRGRPRKADPLFVVVGEKIPFEALDAVEARFDVAPSGVYVAHDSMGATRYIGRGSIFSRLRARKKAQPRELAYFSFYVVREKVHERVIETLLIRASGEQLVFNERKKRVGIEPGNIRDYEAGTLFYERQRRRGRKKKVKTRPRGHR